MLLNMNRLFAIIWFVFSVTCAFAQQNITPQEHKKEIEAYRKEYKAAFLNEEHTPLKKKDLKYLNFYTPDINYRIVAKVVLTPDAEPVNFATSSNILVSLVPYAKAILRIHRHDDTLTLYRSLEHINHPVLKDYLFLPFKDNTSGYSTYGGGRYIDLKMGDIQNNEVIIDFNKAYNPYCAFSDGYSCPVPPAENFIRYNIEAGERNFLKKENKSAEPKHKHHH